MNQIDDETDSGKESRGEIRRWLQQALKQHYPDGQFSFLALGSSGDVFVNLKEPQHVYKVCYETYLAVQATKKNPGFPDRNVPPLTPNYREYHAKEAHVLTSLSGSELTPEVYNIIEQDQYFVLEMERINAGDNHLYTVPFEQLRAKASTIYDLLKTHGFYPGDVEFLLDQNSEVRLIDLGGMSVGLDYSDPENTGQLHKELADHLFLRDSWAYSLLKQRYPDREFTLLQHVKEDSPPVYFVSSDQPPLQYEVMYEPLDYENGDTWRKMDKGRTSITVYNERGQVVTEPKLYRLARVPGAKMILNTILGKKT